MTVKPHDNGATAPTQLREAHRAWKVAVVTAFTATLMLAATGANAADDWYTIEVAIFERLGDAPLAEERWPERIEESRSGFTLSAGDGDGVRVLTAGRTEASSIQKVGRESLAYGGLVSRMARSGQYRPLVHMGWRQPGLSKSEAVPVAVGGASSASPEASQVRGTLRLYRSRYLHLEADLVLSKPTAAYAAANANGATRFTLRERRRMRSGELHYLDHPLFGVLVRATPFRRAGGSFVAEPKEPEAKTPDSEAAAPVSPESGKKP